MPFFHIDITQVVEILPQVSKIRTYLFYIVNIMGADVLPTQGARASATMIMTVEPNYYGPQSLRLNAPMIIITRYLLNSILRDHYACRMSEHLTVPGGRFKNTYELLNQRALKFSYVNKIHIFQCMGKIFCVEFQRYPLKFHTKYLTHTLKDMIFMQFWNFKSS